MRLWVPMWPPLPILSQLLCLWGRRESRKDCPWVGVLGELPEVTPFPLSKDFWCDVYEEKPCCPFHNLQGL